jgi:hypothetical protein
VLVERPARRGAQRVLEHRIDLGGEAEGARHLRVAGPRALVAEQLGRDRGGVLHGPVEPQLVGPAPGALPGGHRLGAGEEGHADIAALDGERGLVHEQLGAVASGGREHRLARGDAQAFADRETRVHVPPREHADHAYRVEPLQKMTSARVVRGAP